MHEYIKDTLWAKYITTRVDALDNIDARSESLFYSSTFQNYRRTKHKHFGLRLSYTGEALMRKYFTSYKYSLVEKPSNQSLISLDKNMKWPYYIGQKYITFFNEVDASWYRLTGNNLEQFTEDM
jgi:hypothetical protein